MSDMLCTRERVSHIGEWFCREERMFLFQRDSLCRCPLSVYTVRLLITSESRESPTRYKHRRSFSRKKAAICQQPISLLFVLFPVLPSIVTSKIYFFYCKRAKKWKCSQTSASFRGKTHIFLSISSSQITFSLFLNRHRTSSSPETSDHLTRFMVLEMLVFYYK